MKNPPHIKLLLKTIKNLRELLKEEWMRDHISPLTEQLNGRELEDIDKGLKAIQRLKDAVVEKEMKQFKFHPDIEPELLKEENE
ncbi:MAG: hypothetical protein CMP39_04220 [Rickettsiales bacterium]|nr:hypothetical protein [Rickettsiales bacterium]